MKFHKYIFISFILISSIAFPQPTFNNIDTLLSKNFEAVNLKDSTLYLTLLNKQAIYKGKTPKNKVDSLAIIQPFIDAYLDFIVSVTEMAQSNDFNIIYSDYKCLNNNVDISSSIGKIPIHVNLIVNNTFSVKMLYWVTCNNGIFSIESPMVPMFVESKE